MKNGEPLTGLASPETTPDNQGALRDRSFHETDQARWDVADPSGVPHRSVDLVEDLTACPALQSTESRKTGGAANSALLRCRP